MVYGEARTQIGAAETSGEVHDRLAALGPDLVDDVLRRWWDAGRVLAGAAQDESQATRARGSFARIASTAAVAALFLPIRIPCPWAGRRLDCR